MNYWVVMAITAIAIVAVMIAIESEPDEVEVEADHEDGRLIWVALGSSALATEANPDFLTVGWVEIVQHAFADRVIAYDFTRLGATAEDIQRESLDAALATRPNIVTLLIGPDDFRDAEEINMFERRLWHILTSLTKQFATPVLATLPDLTVLPSLAKESDVGQLTDERTSWNVAIARVGAVARAEVIDVEATNPPPPETLFTEHEGRFVFTSAGHRWYASLICERIQSLVSEAPAERVSLVETEQLRHR